MGSVRVRYRTGDTDEWDLPEQVSAYELADELHQAVRSPEPQFVNFAVVSRTAEEIDYGRVTLCMDHVVMVEVDGFVDEERIAAWQLASSD